LATSEVSDNTAVGNQALRDNTVGQDNTAVGLFALATNHTGNDNTAIGQGAGQNIMGSSNICIGQGVFGLATDNNTIRIGDNLPSTAGLSACYIGGIYGQFCDPGSAIGLYIDNSGKLGGVPSSQRFKHDIKPMDMASEAILALKPVTFHYNNDAKNTPCFGLIAEEVAEANPNLIIRDKEGKPLTVRYDQVNAMLLNEFLKEHRKVEQMQKQIEALTAGLQKVSAQLEVSKPAPQTALNRQ
jgi:endosialidase-like protein